MVVFSINVKIKQSGNAEVKSGLKRLQKTAQRTQAEFKKIGKRISVDRVKALNKELKRTNKLASRVKGILVQAFGAIGIGLAIRGLVRLNDEYTNFQNRLKIVTKGSADLANVTKKLFDVARETRVSFGATAELFTRVAIATAELGRSQKSVIAFTRTLNKAVILSGATAAEAKNGIIQLSQGMASGALRGDELRSVLEQLPKVADAISKAMGITRGKLREMGEAGKITADIILDSMATAAKQIDKDFAKTIPTISGGFTNLTTDVQQMVGELEKATGVSEFFARGMITLGQNIRLVVKSLALMTLGFVSVKIQAALAGVSVGSFALKAKSMVAALNPILLLAILAAKAIHFMADEFTKTTSEMESFEDAAEKMTAIDVLVGKVSTFKNELFRMRLELRNGRKESKSFVARMEHLDTAITKGEKTIVTMTRAMLGLGKALISHNEALNESEDRTIEQGRLAKLRARDLEIEKKLLKEVKLIEKTSTKGPGSVSEDDKKIIRDRLEKIRGIQELTKAEDDLLKKGEEKIRQSLLLQGIIDRNTTGVKEAKAALEELNKVTITKVKVPKFHEGFKAGIKAIKELAKETDAMGNLSQAAFAKIVEGLQKNVKGADTFREKINRIRFIMAAVPGIAAAGEAAIKKLLGPKESEEFFDQLDVLNAKLKEGILNSEQFREEVRKMGPDGKKAGTEFGDGISAGFRKIHDEANDLKRVGEEIVDLFVNKAVDAIHTFVTEGTLDFKQFATDLLKQIAKIIIRLLIVKALSALTSNTSELANTGIQAVGDAAITESHKNDARVHGGPVEAGRPYLVGENGPEVVVPDQSGRVLSNASLQSAPPPPPQVNVTVVNVIDPDEQEAAINSGDLDQAIINVLARNGDQGRQALQQS